jgi:hypothetical protein
MASASLISTKQDIRKKLDEMLERARPRSTKDFLTHCAYPMYMVRQMRRWMTEGSSEGVTWAPLSHKYAEWKLINMAGMPGHGAKMLIATGKLFESVVGRELKREPSEISYTDAGGQEKISLTGGIGDSGLPHHFVKVTESSLTVSTDLEYAKDVNAARKIWFFKDDFKKRLKAMHKGWFATGSVKVFQ